MGPPNLTHHSINPVRILTVRHNQGSRSRYRRRDRLPLYSGTCYTVLLLRGYAWIDDVVSLFISVFTLSHQNTVAIFTLKPTANDSL